MRYYDKVTPDGTRDLLFGECVSRGEAVSRLTTMFRARGYRQVITPAIEFYDVFGSSAAHFPQENMYKLTDTRGRLMSYGRTAQSQSPGWWRRVWQPPRCRCASITVKTFIVWSMICAVNATRCFRPEWS